MDVYSIVNEIVIQINGLLKINAFHELLVGIKDKSRLLKELENINFIVRLSNNIKKELFVTCFFQILRMNVRFQSEMIAFFAKNPDTMCL